VTAKNTIAEQILKHLADIQGASHQTISHGDPFKLPRLISAGNGGTIQISKAIDDLISDLAESLKQTRPLLRKTVRQDEWRAMVRRTIGPELARIDLIPPFDEAAADVVRALEQRLETQLATTSQREHVFGASLFANEGIPPFCIGPVTIEPRSDWLARKRLDGGISPATGRRLLKVWSGGKVGPRKPSLEATHERDILDAIGGAAYVISVDVSGYLSGAGIDAAATGARLALACIGLLWSDPANAMRGFRLRYDPPAHRRVALSFVPGRLALASRTRNGLPFGPDVELAEWQTQLANSHAVFSAAGEAITYLISPDDAAPRANLMSTLSQALLWFNAGCREESDAFAVVNFAACLDALSEGQGTRGIGQLLEARLGIQMTNPINSGGATFRATVELIYKEGRSRTVHGTSNRVGHDWSITRRLAQDLTRIALFQCLDFVGEKPDALEAAQLRQADAD
jgi:hypothetical protein